MTDSRDEYGIGKPIDDDYIDVDPQRADVSSTEHEEEPPIERTPSAAERYDLSMRLDASGGNGSAAESDGMIDQNAVYQNDGRSKTETFFYVQDVPKERRQQFQRLYRLQEGERDSERKELNRRTDRTRTISTFCSQLDMSSYHKDRVEHIMDSINMSHMAHYSSPMVILGIITLVANADDRFIRDETRFKDLVRDVGSDMSDIKNIRRLVRDKSDAL
jgi:hypothetical protein